MDQQFVSILVSLIAIIFVFLFAIKKFSNQIQHLLGNKFKDLIERFTNTPIKGTLEELVLHLLFNQALQSLLCLYHLWMLEF